MPALEYLPETENALDHGFDTMTAMVDRVLAAAGKETRCEYEDPNHTWPCGARAVVGHVEFGMHFCEQHFQEMVEGF